MVSEDERREALSYVRHQVAKGPDVIRQTIEKGYDQLWGQIQGLSDDQAKCKPVPDEWCVLEVLQHVVESRELTARRCFALALGERPPAVGPIGAIKGEVPHSLAEARSALNVAQQELLRFVDMLAQGANVQTTMAHPSVGPLNCQEWAVFERLHDAVHVNQIEEIKASRGFPSS